MQVYSSTSYASDAAAGAAIGAFAGFYLVSSLISIAISVIQIVALWKVFTKAGKEGWRAIVPFLNAYTLFEVAGMEGWKFLLLLIPFYNIYLVFKVNINLAKAFGKDTAFGIGLVLLNLIFMCILAFDKDQYQLGGTTPGANGNASTQPAAPKPQVGDSWVNGKE